MTARWLVCLAVAGAGVPAQARDGVDRIGSLPVEFVENRGQWETGARFVAHLEGLVIRVEEGAVLLQLHEDPTSGVLVRLELEGASPDARLEGLDRRPGERHYFLGNDPAGWRRHVRAFGSVAHRGVYPGVDLVLHGEDGRPKLDWAVAANARLEDVVVRVEGARGLGVDERGALVIDTEAGPMVQLPPVSWQEGPEREEVAVSYRVLGGERFGFVAGGWDRAADLWIDPGLEWATYLGGSGLTDSAHDVAVAPNGDVVVTGTAYPTGFPTTPGAFVSVGPSPLAAIFVTRLTAAGDALEFSSVLGTMKTYGGSFGAALDVDDAGRVTAVGNTNSSDFPTTPGAFDTERDHVGNSTGVVFRLSADGSELVFSTFLEGVGPSGSDTLADVAVAPSGSSVVCGRANSLDFPVTPGAFDTLFELSEAFVVRLDPDGSSLEWGTFLGGASQEWGNSLHLAEDGTVTVAGETFSDDFPVTPGAFDTIRDPWTWDTFVARLSADGSSLLWGTFLGGNQDENTEAVTVDPSGTVFVAGSTPSYDFPTTPGAVQESAKPMPDGFVARLSADGSSLLYGTYFGSEYKDIIYDLDVDAAGNATFTGFTNGLVATTPGAFQESHQGSTDAFVARIDASGTRLLYASFLGGTGTLSEHMFALAPRPEGSWVIGGECMGSFPVTPGAYDTTYNGGVYDAIVLEMDLLPTGAERYGTSTPACHGPLVIGVTEMPVPAASGFALTCAGAPPGAPGLLVVSTTALAAPVPVVGAGLWVAPILPSLVLPVVAGAASPYAETPLPLPPGSTGLVLHAQYGFWNPPSCPGPAPASSSAGLKVTVQ